ncbi:MAG: hypothetical protein HRT58_22395 [Crocinitomicaceae bacterium]|nr:PorT family protein [Flavobacteriales bacterium]NQZ38428.1 hypothetical protein [Crocinitomicaceae bacterium]
MKVENQNIEELIRNASSKETYSIQDGDWEQLQMMMSKDPRRKRIGWIWIATVGIILIVSGIFLSNKEGTSDNGIGGTVNMTESEIVDKNGRQEKTTLDPAAKSESAARSTAKALETALVLIDEQEAYADLNNDRQTEAAWKPIVVSNLAAGTTGEKEPVVRTEFNHELMAIGDTEDSLSSVHELTSNPLRTDKEEPSEQLITDVVAVDSIAPVVTSLEVDSVLLTQSTAQRSVDSIGSTPAKEERVNRKFHYYLGIGTEWSLTSKMPIGPTKLKLQLGGEYQFLNRLSVLLGLNYTMKDYETNAEGYTVEQGFWTGGIKPSSISAECNVLEIPLKFRYYFSAQDKRRSSFYLTAGASSYLMASERYSFTYNVVDSTLKQGWSGAWKNAHYFSVLHFSAGYQKSFERNWSLLVEPYVDLSLKGIGFGQVKLTSFGLSLNVKY